MIDVIDILAERYGWAYEAIWDLPFADTVPLLKKANKGKLEDLSSLLSIIHNPHLPKGKINKLPELLERNIKKLSTSEDRPIKAQKDWADQLKSIDNKIRNRNG